MSAKPKIYLSVLADIDDRAARKLAKKTVLAAVKAGKGPAEAAELVRVALREAGKLTPDVAPVVARLAEAEVQRPDEKAAAAKAAYKPITATATEEAPEKVPAKKGKEKIYLSVLADIDDRSARKLAKKTAQAAVKAGKGPAEAAELVRVALREAGKLTPDVAPVVARLAEAEVQRPDEKAAAAEAEAVPVQEALEETVDFTPDAAPVAARPAEAEVPWPDEKAAAADAVAAAPPPPVAVPEPRKAKAREVIAKAGMDLSALADIDNRVARGLAEETALAAVKAGKGPAEVAAQVKAALKEARKLTPNTALAVARLAEAEVQRPDEKVAVAETVRVQAALKEAGEIMPDVALGIARLTDAEVQPPDEKAAVTEADKPITATATEKVPAPEKTPAKEGDSGERVDLSILDGISDRMARAVARSIFNKVAGQGGSQKDAVEEIRAALLGMDRLSSEVETVLAQLEQ